jgi:hypothetical protein
MRIPNRAVRIAALKKIEKDRNLILESSKDTAGISNEAVLAAVFFKFIGADIIYKEYVADWWAMEHDLIKLALSLVQYHADHGSYPEKLSDLVPSYLDAIPKDIFNDSDLHYTREGKGYVLYSVGRNGEDDGGLDMPTSLMGISISGGPMTYEDEEGNVYKEKPRDRDDIIIRVPYKKKLK